MGIVMGDKSISFRSLFAALLALALIGCGHNDPLNRLTTSFSSQTTHGRIAAKKQLKPTVKHMVLTAYNGSGGKGSSVSF